MPKEIIIKKVELENFLCYTNTFEFEFVNGLTLICGINGKGKTSLMESIPYTFYGSTSKGIEGDDVINKKVKKNCRTTVYFDVVNQGRLESYTLSRYRGHKKFGTTAILDGPVKAEGAREVKAKIESLILPQKLFLNTVFFGQKVKDFFTALSDSQKKDIFRKVLQLDDFIFYAKSAKAKEDEIEKDIQKLDRDMAIMYSLIEERKSRIKSLNDDKEKFIKDKSAKIVALNGEIEAVNNQIKEKGLSIKKVCSDLDKKGTILKISQLDQELTDIAMKEQQEINLINEKKRLKSQELALMAKQETDSVNTQITTKIQQDTKDLLVNQQNLKKLESTLENQMYKLTQDISTSIKSRDSSKKEMDKLDKAINAENPICPTCGKPLEEDVKIKLQAEYIMHKGLYESLSAMVDELDKSRNKTDTKQSEVSCDLVVVASQITKVVDDAEKEKENLHSAISQRLRQAQLKLDAVCKNMIDEVEKKYLDKRTSLDNELVSLRGILKQYDEIDSINKEIDDLLKVRDEKQTTISVLEEQVFDESQIKSTKHQLKEAQIQIGIIQKGKDDLAKKMAVISFWRTGFSPSGIPSMLIDESIPFMNDNISEYMDRISGGRYTVSFDTLGETKSGEMRDKISIHFFDTITENNCTSTISGGQERIVDVATILTLNDLQTLMHDTKFNILIFDEIFDSLDVENTEKISGLLKSISQDKSINIISHTQVNQLEADRTLNLNTGTLTI